MTNIYMFILENQDLISKMSLPPILYPTIINSKFLIKNISQKMGNLFFYLLWPWCFALVMVFYYMNRKVSKMKVCIREWATAMTELNMLDFWKTVDVLGTLD